tara:strand:- start:6504 stop:6827 length:324 start_codon:yes stop_codon:yes gene_type:complete
MQKQKTISCDFATASKCIRTHKLVVEDSLQVDMSSVSIESDKSDVRVMLAKCIALLESILALYDSDAACKHTDPVIEKVFNSLTGYGSSQNQTEEQAAFMEVVKANK